MPLNYIMGDGPSESDEFRGPRTPRMATRIWREGDIGWVADIIEAAWTRWLEVYPKEWRTVGQAIPHVHLRTSWSCDRPRVPGGRKDERMEVDADNNEYLAAREDWERAGSIGPPPEFPPPRVLGHAHSHDHGICLDPWLVDHTSDEDSLETVLRHEIAHAIAGGMGHSGEWLWMCQIIGHELTPSEHEMSRRGIEAVLMDHA